MRILTIAPVPFFVPRGTPISILERLKILSEICDEIDVVTYHLGNDIHLENVTIYRIPDLKFIKNVPVGPSFIKLILDLLLSVKVLVLLIRGDYNLIHSNEEGSILGAIYSQIFGIPHIYDFHSSLPDVIENFGHRRYMIFKRAFIFIERFVIRHSNAIITISPALTEYVKTINSDIPIITIENTNESVDLSFVSHEVIRDIKKMFKISEKNRIILYMGTFENYQGLELTLKTAKLVCDTNRDIIFLLVGGDKKQVDYYNKKTLELGLKKHVLFARRRPQEEMSAFINIADVLISPRIRGMNTPLKIYTYLRSGKPIVATNIASHTQVLNADIACLVEPEPLSLANGIIKVLTNESYSRCIADKAKDFYSNHHNKDSILHKTKKIINLAVQ